MINIKKEILVPYSSSQMFALVNDIASYSQFLPNCIESTVYRETENEIEAGIIVSVAGKRYNLRTKNQLIKSQSMDMTLIEGPFQRFSGTWFFKDCGVNKSLLTLQLAFELSTGIIPVILVKKLLTPQIDKITTAFVTRANMLYT